MPLHVPKHTCAETHLFVGKAGLSCAAILLTVRLFQDMSCLRINIFATPFLSRLVFVSICDVMMHCNVMKTYENCEMNDGRCEVPVIYLSLALAGLGPPFRRAGGLKRQC